MSDTPQKPTNPKQTWRNCPFCGSTWTALDLRGIEGHLRYVMCWNCEAEGPPTNGHDDAIDAWNNRVDENGGSGHE